MPSITITSITVGASIGGKHRIYVDYTHDTLTDLQLRYKIDAGSWVAVVGDVSPDTIVVDEIVSDEAVHSFLLEHEGDVVSDTFNFTSPSDDRELIDIAITEAVLTAQYDDLYEFEEGDWARAAWLIIARENADPAITECLMSKCTKTIDKNARKESIVLGVFEVDIEIDQAP